MTKDEVIVQINDAVAQLKSDPGVSAWAQGYDDGFFAAMQSVVNWLKKEDNE
jgi:hypothetical protein